MGLAALNRTQPVLPMGLGYVEGIAHDYVRNGTTTLFAALDIASGNVLTERRPRHRHQEFLGFLKRIDKAVPATLELHLILDSYATHKHVKVRAWLASRPRFYLHFTPTCSSWLNQVERWFGLIAQQAIRRGSFNSVKEPIAKINRRQNQSLCPAIQPNLQTLRLDRYRGLHLSKTRQTMLTHFWDRTLALP